MQRKYINCYKNLAFGGKLMYKFERYRQLGPANFNQPVGFKMDPENRWVKKSETIPWDTIEEKKDRVDDALCATRAAIEEGIVPGGGVAYIRASEALEGLKGDNEDETTGIEIIKRAIEEPLRQIVANAGKEGAVVVQKVREGKGDFGYNARTDVYENLHAAGVVDPAKVTRVALENAASIAGMFLTTECVIVEKKEDKPEMPMGAPGMGGMGGMM